MEEGKENILGNRKMIRKHTKMDDNPFWEHGEWRARIPIASPHDGKSSF